MITLEDSIINSIRGFGARTIIFLVAVAAVLSWSAGHAFAQFSDRDNPTQLTSKELIGRGGEENREVYYTFMAGPGDVTLTMNVVAAGSTVTIELFDSKSKPIRFKDHPNYDFGVGSSGKNEQGMVTLHLTKRQRVLMRITQSYPNSTKSYRIRFAGAIEVGDAGKSPVSGSTSDARVMHVIMKDGSTQDIDLDRVDRITFTP